MNNLWVRVTRLEETVGAPLTKDATMLADRVVYLEGQINPLLLEDTKDVCSFLLKVPSLP